MENLDKLKKLTGESDTELLSLLLEDSEQFVLSYTGRRQMMPGLEKTARDLALIAYNRMGTEGENGRSEGGESYTFNDAPKAIYDVLNRHRLARIAGRRFERVKKNEDKTEPPETAPPETGSTEEG